jgi:YebC/PmpR family DNA-binding regulatory protein
MPLDNIERAIKKGSGGAEGGSLAELTLEGYGPAGTAILVSALSDNRNRTVQEVRSAFTRHGGNLGESGSVSWIFEAKGVITIKTKGIDPDELALTAIDAGAEDVKTEKDYVEVYTKPDGLENVRKALEKKGLDIDTTELQNVPKTTVQTDDKAALQILRLLDKLEEIDGVQNVSSNADFSDAAMEQYQSQPA